MQRQEQACYGVLQESQTRGGDLGPVVEIEGDMAPIEEPAPCDQAANEKE